MFSRILVFILLFFIYSFSLLSQVHPSVKKGTKSNWIVKKEFEITNSVNQEEAGDHYYLLYDRQVNILKKESFRHFAIQLLNENGIQEFSNVEIQIDPKYESLFLHEINVYRDGKKIDKLSTHSIQSFQRETSLDRHIYDGSITAYVNLDDIREGDVLEYSYTIKGRNPIYGSIIEERFDFEFGIPVKEIFAKIILPINEEVEFFNNKKGFDFSKLKKKGNVNSYEWNFKNVPALFREDNLPAWYDPYAYVRISNVKNWRDLADWGVGLFRVNDKDKAKIKKLVKAHNTGNKEKDILSLIHFVQNEVRYFGLEGGLSGYKPHPPSQILDQRYGDCKDKSLLLSTSLNLLGVVSYPMLVHSSQGISIEKHLPGIYNFNHCVVVFEYKGKEYYIDPTLSFQGGSLEDYYFPSYHYGLVISKETTDLKDLPDSDPGLAEVTEKFISKGLDKPVKLNVTSFYEGKRADFIREYLLGNSKSKISRLYLEYYSSIYPSIELVKEIEWYDKIEDGKNTIETNEFYSIPEMWQKTVADSNVMAMETYPILLRDAISLVKTSERKMPYYLRHPTKIEHITKVVFHEAWSVESDYDLIELPGIKFDKSIIYDEDKFEATITERYESTGHYLKPMEYKKYRKKVEELLDVAGFYSSYNLNSENKESSIGTDLANTFLIIVAVGLIIYVLLFLFAKYLQQPS